MRNHAALLLLVFLVSSRPALAQPTTGDVLIGGNGAQPVAIRFDRSGSPVTAHPALLATSLFGQVPGNTLRYPSLRDLIVDHDNATAVGAVFDVPTSWLVRFDPNTGLVLGTLTHFPSPSSSTFYPYHLSRDQDGGYVIAGPRDQLFKVDARGLVVASLNLKAALPSFPTAYDYLVDHDDGKAILFYPNNLFKLDRITGAITSIYATAMNHGTSYQMCQEFATGRILWGTGDGAQPSGCRGVMAVDLGSVSPAPTTLLGAPNCPIQDFYYAYGSRLDRQSAANPELLFAGHGPWAGLGAVDLSATPPRVRIHHFLNGEFFAFGLDIVGSVNLTSRLTSPYRWDLDVSFPGQGGNAYIVAISLTGTHPGVPIAGRTVHLTPDGFTFATLPAGLPPVWSGHLGTLDGRGRARAVLDLSLLAGALDGRPIHFVALVFDPKAPGGVAEISDPYVIVPGASF